MGMAEDDRGKACGRGVQVQGEEFVEDVDEDAAHFDYPGVGEISGPVGPVGVAAHRMHRGDLLKRFQYLWIADISGVDDELDAG